MASTSFSCRMFIKTSPENAGYRAVYMSAIQEMPVDLRKSWVEVITDDANRDQDHEGGEYVSCRSYILNLDGTVGVLDEDAEFDAGESSAHYQSLEEAIAALTPVEQNGELLRRPSVSSDYLDFSATPESLRLLNPALFTNNMAHLGAMSGPLIYTSIKTLAKLHADLRRLGPALMKKLKDISAWIRAHPYQTAGIVGGTILFILACCTPAILAAAGFSSIGPVAGSAAAAWQASMGSVAAGSLFAFLQSAAMGGAAMGVFVGVGAAGGGIAITAGLAASHVTVEKVEGVFKKEVIDRVGPVVDGIKDFVKEEVIGKVVPNVKDFVDKEIIGGVVPNVKNFVEKQIVGSVVEKFKVFFWKEKEDE